MLISIADFYKYVEISPNTDATKTLDPYILQAEQFDLRPFLGDALYFDINSNITVQQYIDLLNGKDYTPTNSVNQLRYEGLKQALVYFAYARYLTSSNIRPTATGFVRKENQYSTELKYDELVRRSQEYKSMGNACLSDAGLYLNNFASVYTLWGVSCNTMAKTALKITVI